MIGASKNASSSRTNLVLNHLQSAILSRELVGGSRLPNEDMIAKDLNISRTPVREAIKVLEATGVIEIRRGVGTFVRKGAETAIRQLVLFQTLLDDASPRELAEVRFMIERTAAELAASNRTDDQLVRMRQANDRLIELASQPDASLDELTEADVAFHDEIYEACGNRLVTCLGRFLIGLVKPLIRASLRREGGLKAAQNHDLVYRMIVAQNRGGARECLSSEVVSVGLDHWQSSLEQADK